MEIYNKSYRYVIGVDDIVEFVFKTIGVNNKIINKYGAFNIMEIIPRSGEITKACFIEKYENVLLIKDLEPL